MLDEILRTARLETVLYFRALMTAPFAVRVPAAEGQIRFHVAGEGHAWIGLASGACAELAPGDLALVGRGAEHVLADSEASGRGLAIPLAEAMARAHRPDAHTVHFGSEAACHAEAPSHPPPSALVCGHFGWNARCLHPVLGALPPLLVRRAGDGHDFGWLDRLLAHVQREADEQRPGFRTVTRRLSEVALIEILRGEPQEHAACAPLPALADPGLRRALEAIHTDPSATWTIDRLARKAGVSRTVLVDRFRERLGTSPMRYVADWRMQTAASLLEDPSRSVGQVAAAVGYASEAAFSRAFRSAFGEPPGRMRRAIVG